MRVLQQKDKGMGGKYFKKISNISALSNVSLCPHSFCGCCIF